MLTRMFHKLTRALVCLLFGRQSLCSVWCMNNYTAPLQNLPAKQNPARSSRGFMKHSDEQQSRTSDNMAIMLPILRTIILLILTAILSGCASFAPRYQITHRYEPPTDPAAGICLGKCTQQLTAC